MIQVDNQILILSNREKSAIPGTHGTDGRFGSIRH